MIVSLIVAAAGGAPSKTLICVLSGACLTLPFIAMKLLQKEINLAFFLFCEIYALGPMLGHAYKLYYLLPWWDVALHTAGGFVFAVFGQYLAGLIYKNGEPPLLMKALFALFFSMALAAVWEFIEYGCDLFLGTDMQQDTIVSFIHSYLLGGEAGEIGALENIADVIVNGQPLGVGGYLDIGLHDTMQDMLVETLGAAVYTALLLIDREKHPVLYEKAETPPTAKTE